jgi:hypothetical protein
MALLRVAETGENALGQHKPNESAVKNVSERDLGEAGRQEGASKDQQQGTQ